MNQKYSRFKGWQVSNFGLFKPHWGAYYTMEIKKCQRLSRIIGSDNLKILEIGFGNGSFMGWARSVGHTVHGVEIEEEQLIAAKNCGFNVGRSIDHFMGKCNLESYDGIVAFDVFEHLSYSELVEFLTKAKALLNTNGWILARFPNGDSPYGRINQNGDLTHKLSIGSSAINQIASDCGLNLLAVDCQRTPFVGVGAVRLIVNLVVLWVRMVLEFPTQILLNAYYPGRFKWFSLTPNLVVLMSKR